MTSSSPAGGPVPTYEFGVLLSQCRNPEQAHALHQICPDDRVENAGRHARLRCVRQAESLSAAIADAFDDIAQVSGRTWPRFRWTPTAHNRPTMGCR